MIRSSGNKEHTSQPSQIARVWRTLRLIAIVLLVGILFLRLTGAAERLAYMPSQEQHVTPRGAEDVWITTEDGLRLHAWFWRARDAEPGEVRPAVLHLHGNAGHMGHHRSFSEFLTKSGVHVLMLDYRGYGRSDAGRLRRDALLLDAHAALDALIARPDVERTRVGVYGVSLGGAFALELTKARPEVDRLATLSTFSSWGGVAHDWMPLIGPLLVPSGWDPVDGLERLGDRPYLIVHGTDDEVIHSRHARVLEKAAESAGVPVRLHLATGGDHNRTLETHPDAKGVIADFFAEMATHQPESRDGSK